MGRRSLEFQLLLVFYVTCARTAQIAGAFRALNPRPSSANEAKDAHPHDTKGPRRPASARMRQPGAADAVVQRYVHQHFGLHDQTTSSGLKNVALQYNDGGAHEPNFENSAENILASCNADTMVSIFKVIPRIRVLTAVVVLDQ